MRFSLLLTIFVVLGVSVLQAKTDTIRVMQYNMLNYGNSENPHSFKDARLKVILENIRPDIFGANEIINSPANSENLLKNVLGTGWEKGRFINTNNQIQTNMLFWRSEKFGLKSQRSICQNLRDIIAYELYYKDTFSMTHDTVFLTIILAHLKAGRGVEEQKARSLETQAVIDYLNSTGKHANHILIGDLNLYSSSEQAYMNLINSPNSISKFHDPINRPGNWGSNASFAAIHTQSTRTATLMDGGADGGLDDRLDIQLASSYVMNNSAGVQYIAGTYKAWGQDGQHYNRSLIDLPQNNLVSPDLALSLYEMSEHLPVVADYRIRSGTSVLIDNLNNVKYDVKVINPILDNQLSVFFDEELEGKPVSLALYSFDAVCHWSTTTIASSQHVVYHLNNIRSGIYFLRITAENGYSATMKVVK